MNWKKTSERRAFTLIELLVVMAVISVLAALLLPVLDRGKQRAWATSCLSGMRQIGVAARMFGDDNDDNLPRSSHTGESWMSTLQMYSHGTNLWRCPKDFKARLCSYAVNDFLLPPEFASQTNHSRYPLVPSPSDTFWLGECADNYSFIDHFHFRDEEDGGYTPLSFASQVAIRRHLEGANYLFVDGHVQLLKWNLLRNNLTNGGSRFVDPGRNP